MNGGCLRKEQIRSVQGQVAVNFIRAHLVITGNAILTAGIHQYTGADNVGLQKDLGVLNRTVHMTFRRKINNNIGVLFFKKLIHTLPVTDIQLHKTEFGIIHNSF